MNLTRDGLTRQAEEIGKKNGAALVGFAPISRFDNAPDLYHPKRIFPQVKTVIAFAVPQLRGALKAVEEGTYFNAYINDSYYFLNEIMSPMMLRSVCMFLESYGYTSVPIHNPFFPHMGRQLREEQPTGPDGMISLRIMGVAAGLGEFGMHKLFMTPEFGPRQRVFAIFTDAELTPTPLFKGSVCDECGLCIKACQANAIGSVRSEKIVIDDMEYSHAPLDIAACGKLHGGRDPEHDPFFNTGDTKGEYTKHRDAVHQRYRHYSVCVGRGCIRACLHHLETTGRISAKFELPFIQRKQWDASETWPLKNR